MNGMTRESRTISMAIYSWLDLTWQCDILLDLYRYTHTSRHTLSLRFTRADLSLKSERPRQKNWRNSTEKNGVLEALLTFQFERWRQTKENGNGFLEEFSLRIQYTFDAHSWLITSWLKTKKDVDNLMISLQCLPFAGSPPSLFVYSSRQQERRCLWLSGCDASRSGAKPIAKQESVRSSTKAADIFCKLQCRGDSCLGERARALELNLLQLIAWQLYGRDSLCVHDHHDSTRRKWLFLGRCYLIPPSSWWSRKSIVILVVFVLSLTYSMNEWMNMDCNVYK